MKTAVEYIELRLLGIASFDSEELRLRYKDIIKQAKEIEKKQIMQAFQVGIDQDNNFYVAEKYYKKTYNQTNETISKSKF